MLSYLHAFHAGNFADIQKHAALVLAIRMMQAKPSGIACFDTHAGSAHYDLLGERAMKTGEAAAGVRKVWGCREQMPSDDWQAMFSALAKNVSDEGQLRYYPGSPAWLSRYLRPQDSLTAFELHPAEGETLARWAADRTGIRVLQEDGLGGLLRQLPPRQPRLLVLVDPSYEVKTEYEDVARTVESAWRKCRHGVYLIWYPILAGRPDERLKALVSASAVQKVWRQEILLTHPPQRGMSGSGLLVVNPPWGFDTRMASLMNEASAAGGLDITSRTDWLVPE